MEAVAKVEKVVEGTEGRVVEVLPPRRPDRMGPTGDQKMRRPVLLLC